jgi:uncharacterized protein (TIGR02594 family)
MASLPKKYQWLNDEPGPLMLMAAIAEYGTMEMSGTADNPKILSWAEEVGLGQTYSGDSIPWCGLFMAMCAKRANWAQPPGPLWALNWAKWGVERDGGKPMLGDVLVFKRTGGGHVAMYVGEDLSSWHIIGGNQSDRVSIVRRAKVPTYAVRHAPWRIAQPPNVRRVFLTSLGTPTAGSEA